jgi:hypothetical protein
VRLRVPSSPRCRGRRPVGRRPAGRAQAWLAAALPAAVVAWMLAFGKLGRVGGVLLVAAYGAFLALSFG